MRGWIRQFMMGLVLVAGSTRQLDSAPPDDERFLDGLRQRQLFQLAENYCRGQLAGQLPDVQRGQLTEELIRTYGQHALNAPATERARLWKSAEDTARDFLQQHRDHPRAFLIRLQDGLTRLARGELARQEAEVGPTPEQSLAAALQIVREAVGVLDELDRDLRREIPQRTRKPGTDGVLTPDELLALLLQVQYQQARAYRNRALCYPFESNDRLAALTQAVDLLEKSLTQLKPEDDLYWPVNVERIACRRLLGDLQRTGELLVETQTESAPASVQLLLRAEAVRLLLAARDPDQALEAIQQGREIEGEPSAELDFARVETYVALWRAADAAGDKSKARQWRDEAVQAVTFVEETHGPYWGHRANLLLVTSLGSSDANGDLEILMRAARNSYEKHRLDEAVDAYDRAAQRAETTSQQDLAFEARYTAALIEKERQRPDEARRRFRQLALALRDHPNASGAHTHAIVLAAEIARKDRDYLPEYEALLDEHLQTWPSDGGSHQVRVWKGRLAESRREWPVAAEIYGQVPPDAESYLEALRSLVRCSLAELADLRARGKPTEETAARIAQYLEAIVIPDNRLPDRWSEAAREAAVAAARVRLEFLAPGDSRAENILRSALQGEPRGSAEWESRAQTLLVVAVGGQPERRLEAEQILQQIGDASPAQLLELVKQLSDLSSRTPAAERSELARLQLTAIGLLGPLEPQLDDAARLVLARTAAEAQLATGQGAAALRAFETLVARHPDDLRIREGYAQTLLESPDSARWAQAAVEWRRIDKASPPETEAWFRAKYGVARALFQQGKKREAAVHIQLLQTTHNLDASALKAQFIELLRKCEP